MIVVRWPHGGAQLQPDRVVVEHRGLAFGWVPGRPQLFGVDPRGSPPPGGAWSPYPVPAPVLLDGATRAFPVITARPRWNAASFGAERLGKLHRHHAAVDLHAVMGAPVVSPVDGAITGIQPYYRTKSGKQTDAVLISDGENTYLLGEVTPGSPDAAGVAVGDPVFAGQLVGTVGATGHLHFGIYAGRLRSMGESERWLWGQPPPPHLRDPGSFLRASIALDEPASPPAPPLDPVAPPDDPPVWSPEAWDFEPEPPPVEPAPPGAPPWTPLDPLYTPGPEAPPWSPAPDNWRPTSPPPTRPAPYVARAPGPGRWGLAALALLALAALGRERER